MRDPVFRLQPPIKADIHTTDADASGNAGDPDVEVPVDQGHRLESR